MAKKIVCIFILLSFLLLPCKKISATAADDFEYYQKYPLYSKYEKKQKYDKYKKYAKNKKKYGFASAKEKAQAKDAYNKYKLYKKDPKKYSSYAQYYEKYKKYSKYKKNVTPYSKYSQYKKYKNYDKQQYKSYKNYGSAEYKAGHDRYVAFMNDLGNVTTNTGPEIRVGLWSYSKDDLISEPFKISGNKIFDVTDCDSTTIGQIAIGEEARVTYVEGSGGTLRVYDSNETPAFVSTDLENGKVCFEANDDDNSDMLFDVNKPNSSYDQYRGRIKVQHSYTSDNEDEDGNMRRIWVINMLPLEHYVWGFGEIGGGVDEHSKAMIVASRTYARWYIEYSTKWAEEGFHLLSTSSSQIYRGYDYEKDHASIPALARTTNGIVMKNADGDYALAAYSSWSDGNTRKYEDGHWGGTCEDATAGSISTTYPELSAVEDPYGRHATLGTCALASAGNHMVGMIANGSLVMARDYEKSYTAILSHYYTGISIVKNY